MAVERGRVTGQALPTLAGAPFLRQRGIQRVVAAIEAAGGRARVVGGAVRNALMGRAPGDVDLATTMPPDEVMEAVRAAGLKAVPTGIGHGTVTVVAFGEACEVTTLRKDVETDGRRAVVAFTTDWKTDAERRDFTMNALYASLDGTLHDPIGGYADLAGRRVRFIGDARTRIREDYLRILRFFRFHAELGRGVPDTAALKACTALAGGLGRISRERIRHELLRLLAAPGAPAAVAAMQAAGVLEAVGLGVAHVARLARLAAVDGVLGRGGDGLLRLAALTLGAEHDAAELATTLRLSGAERDRLLALERNADRPRPGMDDRDLRAMSYRIGRRHTLDVLAFVWAASGDEPGSPRWRGLFREAEAFEPPAFPVAGADLLARGARPGPELGEALARLEAEWLAEDFASGREALLARYAAGDNQGGRQP